MALASAIHQSEETDGIYLNFAVLTRHLVATWVAVNMPDFACLEIAMRGEFYQRLTSDLQTARAGCLKAHWPVCAAKQISLWLMEATSLTFVQQLSDWPSSRCGGRRNGFCGFGMASVRLLRYPRTTIKAEQNRQHSWGWKMRFSTLPWRANGGYLKRC